MQIYIEDENDFFESNQEILSLIYQVIEECLIREKVPYEVELSLTVVNKEEIQKMNKAYRQIDKATDVLSFPQLEATGQGKIDWSNLDEMEVMNLDTQQLMLGDIVLCVDKAKEQAEDYGHSLKREICFLVAHSMFHLLGYDHMNEEDEEEMMQKQEAVLETLDISR
ncbi:rRNA maturation RNase YbeY [Sporanaerobium hydrogeniformans]|uniref:rRNA maturation RNase YbeY n=1 Tax=Sporanaerobium hydrogeniformans TaxID=3072179 RepID=A0AC61DE54_9FIRM|nr:rRNA maturation RNase YbeY [Sporanaerobium hydrogeniformans]PHV71446.1 rRNA maturation RNase YbeY [Sporanaerobium hydrogeniformans]